MSQVSSQIFVQEPQNQSSNGANQSSVFKAISFEKGLDKSLDK
ncbi:MAG: hypothetical protein ACI97K_002949, partial [Glaciecola sp.]